MSPCTGHPYRCMDVSMIAFLVAERVLWEPARRGRAWSLLAAHLCAGALGFDLEAPEAQTIGPRSVPILILTSVVAVKWRRADGETFEEYGVMIKF